MAVRCLNAGFSRVCAASADHSHHRNGETRTASKSIELEQTLTPNFPGTMNPAERKKRVFEQKETNLTK